MASTRTFLFRKPKSWTSQNLTDLRVVQQSLSLAELIGDPYLPSDEDSRFACLASAFSQPTKTELMDFPAIRAAFQNNSFWPVFSWLQKAARADGFVQASKLVLWTLFGCLLGLPDISCGLRILENPIQFTVQPGGIRCMLEYECALCKAGGEYNVPLATVLVQNNNADKSATSQVCKVVSQILGQVYIAYNQDPTKNQYTAFVLCMKQATIWLGSATVPRSYVEELCNGMVLSQDLVVSWSESYDLLESHQRIEAIRLVIGLFKSCLDRDL